MLARQAAERVLLGMRGGSHRRLPGTRREVEAVARLFPAGTVTTLMGEQACESTVQDLARSGRMKGFRYLHFATHGESDPRHAYRSALILAPDPDRSADPLAFDTDGTITAEQIARTWELDADLVVLSACESGLGRAAGGEGYLGFAQPLFAKGARSLVLSLWKVDDDATALLMTRFYQNLLGTRAGLKSPLPKAEALAEAKAWLRGARPRKSARPWRRSLAARSFAARRSRRSLGDVPLMKTPRTGRLRPDRVTGLSERATKLKASFPSGVSQVPAGKQTRREGPHSVAHTGEAATSLFPRCPLRLRGHPLREIKGIDWEDLTLGTGPTWSPTPCEGGFGGGKKPSSCTSLVFIRIPLAASPPLRRHWSLQGIVCVLKWLA